jgi:predicted nucleic acid-binding protein
LIAYADTGFLVSLYVADDHSKTATELVKSDPLFILTPLVETEFVNAIERQVFRKQLTRQEAQAVLSEFAANQRAGAMRSERLPEDVWTDAMALSRRHTAKLGVRTLDALHVAAARAFKPDVFFTFDKRQSQLAKAEGLRVLPG